MRFEREPMHFALVESVDPTYVIHSVAAYGGVVEHNLGGLWRERVMRAYRVRGID
jgi:hypothetical protein